MAKNQFCVSVTNWSEVHSLPNSWPPLLLRKLLELAEFDDPVADEELLEMTLMGLQDLGLRKASDAVLQVVFRNSMSSGVRQNSIDDLQDNRPWEQFATVAMQAGIFEAVVLLQKAFPNHFGIPDAIKLGFTIEHTDGENIEISNKALLPTFLLRILACGMPDNAVFRRLFAEELAAEKFPNAEAILWHVEENSISQSSGAEPTKISARTYEVISSWQWLGSLEDLEGWSATG